MFLSQQQIEQIRSQSVQMEQEGTVTKEVLQLIYDERLFHLFVPDELDGRMTSLPEAVKIFQECSRIDGNFGWLVTIGSGGGFFASFMTPGVSLKVFAHRNAVVAGSGTPSGTARRVPGGYMVNGSWKYCSGSTHATVFTANVIIEQEDVNLRKLSAIGPEKEDPEIRSMILLPEQVHIKPDWNAFGLKATASHSIFAKEVFVPDERTFDITEIKNYEHELIYSYPFLQFAQASFASVALGIAQHFLEAAEALLHQKTYHPYVESQLHALQAELQHCENNFYACIQESWNELLQLRCLSQETETRISAECIASAHKSLHCGQMLFPLLGLSAAMEHNVVNQTWRDLQTACQHTLLRSY